MKKVLNYRKYFYIIGALFIGCLFFYITYKTPLAGDDWGYALNGMSGNPFELAISFYNSWSGRFFSELWGFLIAPHKEIWNIINPILFVIIFIAIYKLAHVKSKYVLAPLFILALILSVDDNLRMETYTWLMGTTYVIPLALSLIYFMIIEKMIFDTRSMKTHHIILTILSNIILFYIGLTMENIAAAMILAVIIELIYAYFNHRDMMKYLFINLFSSIISFLIMRMSPGSGARLLRDNAEWASLNIFEKLANGYPSFIDFTFLKNDYLILFLSLTVVLLIFHSRKKLPLLMQLSSIFIQALAVITVFSFVFIKGDYNYLLDSNGLFNMIFWPIYTIDILVLLFMCLEGKRRDKAIFFFTIAGTCNLVMMYSPIFGSRSSLYTVFFMIIVIALVIDEIKMSKSILAILLIISMGVIFDRANEYIFKYRLVGLRQNERLEIIEYYKDHPEVEEAWIPRFPIYTIHGGDVEPSDTYHFETFKDYYGLPQSADKIIFYYMEDE